MIELDHLRPCPHCGSHHTQRQMPARNTATMIGGLVGTACVVSRIVVRPMPVLASALIMGAFIGLLWGARTGQAIGKAIDEAFPRTWKCLECGKNFET